VCVCVCVCVCSADGDEDLWHARKAAITKEHEASRYKYSKAHADLVANLEEQISEREHEREERSLASMSQKKKSYIYSKKIHIHTVCLKKKIHIYIVQERSLASIEAIRRAVDAWEQVGFRV